MRAYEIPAQVTSEGKIELPESLLKHLPREQPVRIIILVNEPIDQSEDDAWNILAAEQFLAGYSEADSIYDKLR